MLLKGLKIMCGHYPRPSREVDAGLIAVTLLRQQQLRMMCD